MPTQTRPDLPTNLLKPLAFLTLIVTDSRASPISQSIGAREMGTTSPNEGLMTIKNILEWLFAAAAVVVVCSVFIWRMRFLRARNRPLGDFFTFIEAPRRRGGPSPWPIRPGSQTRDGGLTPIPLDRQRRGRTHATDVDSEGRRTGEPDPDDVNGDVTEKEVLPAYEVKGGPPNYSQFLAVDLGTGASARLQITETMPVGTLPQSQPVEFHSGTMNPSTQPSSDLSIQLPHPPPLYHTVR